MGKILEMVKKLREMETQELFDRFKHIIRAQAILEYLDTKEDADLTFEVRFAGEEIIRRMESGYTVRLTKNDKKRRNNK